MKDYVCTQRVLFLKSVCIFKGCSLNQFTTAPELMRFRIQDKTVHFNSLASGAWRPAMHKGATVAELYVCVLGSLSGLLSKVLQLQFVSLRIGPGCDMRKQSENRKRRSFTCLYLSRSQVAFYSYLFCLSSSFSSQAFFQAHPSLQLPVCVSMRACSWISMKATILSKTTVSIRD